MTPLLLLVTILLVLGVVVLVALLVRAARLRRGGQSAAPGFFIDIAPGVPLYVETEPDGPAATRDTTQAQGETERD